MSIGGVVRFGDPRYLRGQIHFEGGSASLGDETRLHGSIAWSILDCASYTKGQTEEMRLVDSMLRDLVAEVPDIPQIPGLPGPPQLPSETTSIARS